MAKRVEPVDRFVGQNIRIFRMAKGITQTQLGERVGVTFQQIQKYEKGVNRVGSSRLAMIAKVLDVPVSRFFDNGVAGSDATVVTELLASPYAIQMLKAFSNLPSDDVRRTLVVLTRSIAKHLDD